MGNHKKIDRVSRQIKYLETECFKFQNNTEELKEIEMSIEYYKKKIKKLGTKNNIDDNIFISNYNNICNILDILGKLSMPVLDCFDSLEEMYLLQYPNNPELAKRIWMDHYHEINRPYSLLKNRCFNLLSNLDNVYILKFKADPPNYNNKSLLYFEK